MGTLSDNSFENSLKCDFLARESFREALLMQLKDLDAQRSPSEGEHLSKAAEPTKKQLLSDDDLWMLAAAGEDSDANGALFTEGV